MRTRGYALAMRVLQSDLFKQLDEKETKECLDFIDRGANELVFILHSKLRMNCYCPRCRAYAMDSKNC